MSDTTSVELGKIDSPDAAEGTSVSEVILEQIDAKVSEIEKQRAGMKPYVVATTVAKTDLEKIEEAFKASTNPDIAAVYKRAIEVAKQLIEEVKIQGQEISDRVATLQVELEGLLQQLKKEDPNNPLASEF